MGSPTRLFGLFLLSSTAALTGGSSGVARSEGTPPAEHPFSYRPKLRGSESTEPFLHLAPGADSFPEEKEAEELTARLGEWATKLRQNPGHAADTLGFLLAPEFKGAPLTPVEEVAILDRPALQVFRAKTMDSAPARDARTFGAEVEALLVDLERVDVAEFLVTAIDLDRENGIARTTVRYDIVGRGRRAWRAECVGRWNMRWSRDADGAWRLLEWTPSEQQHSRAKAPVFTEVTEAALGRNESFRRQLATGLDAWTATIDSDFTRDSNGYNGVSVGDADGDGLDDLYVAQPAGLPNRLYRARGDSTFEDVTERAGLAVLDDTSQSLFADVDNDGDQDLIVATGGGLLLFQNDGKGRFRLVPDAFPFRETLGAVPTGISAADYDRDGFLDVYLCTHASFIGAREAQGPPTPYHDAHNGPSNVLFRNDGRGHFVDVTAETGLGTNNDRFTYAAAWGDYDGDGWPDLLVANDFGRKSLYRNLGSAGGKVRFEDVAAAAGAEDLGGGLSAAFFDYDNDGLLDVYFGNRWSAPGQRVTAAPGFMPEAPAAVRKRYPGLARGNSLLRNRGGGTFEDVSLAARVEMGRWAGCSDAIDFDSDGWDDLYVVNGMITREEGAGDLDAFFWRQVVARSPLTRIIGTPYDEAWRAFNLLLADGSLASHERNVFLRNDGKGGFDDISGTLGLDLDQDGRSFAVFDYDADGDSDLVLMAPRSSPQLRIFRNDFQDRGRVLALRLVGRKSNRDAVGARVTAETDTLRVTRVVNAGSGFLSQHSKELRLGLGESHRIRKLTVRWPSGLVQEFMDVPLDHRLRLEEGAVSFAAEPLRAAPPSGPAAARTAPVPPSRTRWLYEPVPAPDFNLPDADGRKRSLAGLRGHPAVLLFWSALAPGSRAAAEALAGQQSAFARAEVGTLAIALDPEAAPDVGVAYGVLGRYLFLDKREVPLPIAFLLNATGEIVKVYRDGLRTAEILEDARRIEAPAAERLRRALPFPGTFHGPPTSRGKYLSYGRELMEQGLEAPALAAFERAAEGQPSPSTLYRLGTLLAKAGKADSAEAALVRALQQKPDLAEASNDLGALLAEKGDLPGAAARFRAALAATPDYPDALNNLGYTLFLAGQPEKARDLYGKALALQPDFAEALNNLGLLLARQGDLDHAEGYFRQALLKHSGYGEAANNLALVLASRGQSEIAARLLLRLLDANPEYEKAYVTLARIYLTKGRREEGIGVLERLLQRNPGHPLALEILRQFAPR